MIKRDHIFSHIFTGNYYPIPETLTSDIFGERRGEELEDFPAFKSGNCFCNQNDTLQLPAS